MSALGAKIALDLPDEVTGWVPVTQIKPMPVQSLRTAIGTGGTFRTKTVFPDLDRPLKTATHLKNQFHIPSGNHCQLHSLFSKAPPPFSGNNLRAHKGFDRG